MLTTYIIEQKRTGDCGSSDFVLVRGTHVTIAKGLLQVWNSHHEGALSARRPRGPVLRGRTILTINPSRSSRHQVRRACAR